MAATKKSAKKVTSAKAWKAQKANDELDLPSGNVCRLKRPGLPQLMAENVLPDILTPIASDAIERGKSGQVPDPKELEAKLAAQMQDPEGLAKLFDATDRITAHCVLEPKVLYHRCEKEAGQIDQIQESYVPEWEDIPEEDRDPEALYTDEVDYEDKLFIFQFVVGGSRDLESFRTQLGESVARLESGAGSENNS